MNNSMDIRQTKDLLYIIDETDSPIQFPNLNAVLIINLYYIDTVYRYIQYIEAVPVEIPVYIFSSREDVLKYVELNCNRANVYCKKKENRGRDISALLVAAKDITDKYDIIGFIHDKSANTDYLENDVAHWIDNLWDNTLGSSNYINKALDIFRKEQGVGLLIPPQPYGDFFSDWYWEPWRITYDVTKKLAEDLGIEINKNGVVSIGTVFWARRDALKKLLEYPWQYEDFPDEPMPIDGTISHAIEKILGFVALDAGYKTGTIMEKQYASRLLLKAQEDMRVMFQKIHGKEHIFNMFQLRKLDKWEEEVINFCHNNRYVYIYGAGVYGTAVHTFLKDRGITCSGFVVSKGRRTELQIGNMKVYEVDELNNMEGIGIIIGVSYEYRDTVIHTLNEYGIANYMNGF